eukprot:TRINITY_DN3255_c10_g1_i1.p1 TRINITY_DN3255_c10_g1~~TRINITY_DN3255_c10_g1_i1.p1  ORF type:complete len:246 (+),score=90.36 TRINITY_DN3255_c10_g1_i1:46-738(+)
MTEVAKSSIPEEISMDLGNMMLLNKTHYTSFSEDVLLQNAEKDTQLLVAELFGLPSEKVDGGRLATLPYPSTQIPREKPPPKEKDLTKWEEFKKEKGIKTRKTAKREFDEERGEWVATYGAKRRKDDRERDWLREVPDNYVPKVEGGDAFLDAQMERNERVKKQKKREEANQRRAADTSKMADIDSTTAKLATASMGKFDSSAKKKAKTPKNLVKSMGAKKSKVSQRKRR